MAKAGVFGVSGEKVHAGVEKRASFEFLPSFPSPQKELEKKHQLSLTSLQLRDHLHHQLREGHGLGQRARHVGQQLRDHLGVRLRLELLAPGPQEVAQRVVVGDDAVVDHGELAGRARDVGVRVGRARRSVRGPACVRDARVRRQLPAEVESLGLGLLGGERDEGVDLARGLEDRRRGPKRGRGIGVRGRGGGEGRGGAPGRRAERRDVAAAALEPRRQRHDGRVRSGVTPGARRRARRRLRGKGRDRDVGPVAVDGDARGVVPPVLEPAQAREEQVEHLAARARDLVVVVAEDAAHLVRVTRVRDLLCEGAPPRGKEGRREVGRAGEERSESRCSMASSRRSRFFFRNRGGSSSKRGVSSARFRAFPVSSSRSNARERNGTTQPRRRARKWVGKRDERRNARRLAFDRKRKSTERDEGQSKEERSEREQKKELMASFFTLSLSLFLSSGGEGERRIRSIAALAHARFFSSLIGSLYLVAQRSPKGERERKRAMNDGNGDDDFVPSSSFSGPRPGFYFSSGERGVG